MHRNLGKYKTMTKRLLIGIMPVFTGGFIYLTYRTENLLMFRWLEKIGLYSLIDFLRNNEFLQKINIPNWARYSLPDALWLFSFIYIVLTLWNFQINRHSLFWITLVPAIGLFSELGQQFGIIPGTFDVVDLFLLVLACILPFLIVAINFKTTKINYL